MQYKQWEKEYEHESEFIPTVSRKRHSGALEIFEDYLQTNHLRVNGPILDLGCGNGRNAFYLAEKGYKVYATDFIESVLEDVREKAHGRKNLRVIKHALPNPLPFRNNSIGVVMNIVTTPSLTTKELQRSKKEIYRVLKPGGFFLTYLISDQNSYHATLKKKQNQKFVLMPNGIRDRIWNIPDLVKFYQEFTPQLITIKHKEDVVGRKRTLLEMIVGVFRK